MSASSEMSCCGRLYVPAFSDRPFHTQGTSSRRKSAGGSSTNGSRPPTSFPADSPDETHYQLLGVAYGASTADITRAYREAMKRVHPDRVRPERRPAAEELAKRLNLAFAVLSKPASRRDYDQSIRAQGLQEQIMGRYVGGFAGPGMGGAHDPFAQELRREPSDFEKRDQARAGRSATLTMMATFAGVTVAIIAAILLVSVLGWVVDQVF